MLLTGLSRSLVKHCGNTLQVMLFAITGSPKLSIFNYVFRHLNCCSYVKHTTRNVQRFHLTRTNEFFVLHLISKFERAGGSVSFLNCEHICNCQGALNKQTARSLSDPFGNRCIMYSGTIPIIKPQYHMSGLKGLWNTSRFCHKPS